MGKAKRGQQIQKTQSKVAFWSLKKWIKFTLGAAMLLASMGFLYHENKLADPNPFAVVAKVDGEPIVYAEFQMVMNENRAMIFNYFKMKYGVNDNPNFWNSRYGGKVPIQLLQRVALKQLVNDKIQFIMAREKGLIAHASYAQFLKDFANANAQRQQAVASNQIIYGPQQFVKQSYYQYELSKLQGKLIHLLSQQDSLITNTRLKQKYDQLKNKFYTTTGTTKVERIAIDIGNHLNSSISSPSNFAATKQAAQAKLQQVEAKMASGETFAQAAKELNLHVVTEVFNDQTAFSDYMRHPQLRAAAQKLRVGQVSGMIIENNVISLMQSVVRAVNGYLPFSKVESSVRHQYAQEMYNHKVDELVKAAKVEIVGVLPTS